MCSAYWNLTKVRFACPHCLTVQEGALQTHFMGEAGSYTHRYALGQPVAELRGLTITLDGRVDSFTESCIECGTFIDFGAEIVDGRVVRVWPLAAEAVPA